VYVHPGKAVLAGREVDPRTGTIVIKGEFPNPDFLLRPGQYARVRAVTDVLHGALLVPQRAVRELQGVYQVAVVGPDDKVALRVVEPGPREEGLWVIAKGLAPGDRVVVEGLQKVRDGAQVIPKQAAPAAAAAASAAPAAGGTAAE
jgi:membrane fusion protein (multidrug efflux system)